MQDAEDGWKSRYSIENEDLSPEEADEMGISRFEDPHDWLNRVMKQSDISNAELTRRLVEQGLTKANKATLAKWRTGEVLLPLRVLPIICDALGYDPAKTERITAIAVASANPRVSKLLLDAPYNEAKHRMMASMKRLELEKENRKLKKLLQAMIEQFETIIAEKKQEIGQ